MPTVFRSWRLRLPLLLGLGVAGLWSGYWLYAQAQIQNEVEREVAHLQALGGDFVCEDRQWSGFPLRIALSCGATKVVLPDGPTIETASVEAAGQLHNLRYIVTTASGPTFIRLDTGDTLAIEHTPARIGFYTPADGGPQTSLAAEQMVMDGPRGWSFRGRNINLTAGSETPDRLQFSAGGEALSLAGFGTPVIALEALHVEGALEGMPDAPLSDLQALLGEAARLGTRVTIDTFNAQMADVQITALGTIELSPDGPTGTLSTTVSNYGELLADLEQRGVVSKRAVRASRMVAGLLGGRRQADDTVTLALRFHEGQVFWGPFAVAEIPPIN
jgi:hypothetical protein